MDVFVSGRVFSASGSEKAGVLEADQDKKDPGFFMAWTEEYLDLSDPSAGLYGNIIDVFQISGYAIDMSNFNRRRNWDAYYRNP